MMVYLGETPLLLAMKEAAQRARNQKVRGSNFFGSQVIVELFNHIRKVIQSYY